MSIRILKGKQSAGIKFVYDADNRIVPAEKIDPNDPSRAILSRGSYRCCACGEQVTARVSGRERRPHFSHRGLYAERPPCAWRTDFAGRAMFDERNPHGSEGRWHTDTAIQIAFVLSELMGLPLSRDKLVRAANGDRKPDIGTVLADQRVHFEIQASPTNLGSIDRRTFLDAFNLISTLWIINAYRYVTTVEENGSPPAWISDLFTFGSQQLWLWDEEAYATSIRHKHLYLKRVRADRPSEIELVRLDAENVPITAAFRSLLPGSRLPSVTYHHPLAASSPLLRDNLNEVAGEILRATRRSKIERGYTWRVLYGAVRLNVPVPSVGVSTLPDADARSWFESFTTLYERPVPNGDGCTDDEAGGYSK